MSPQDRGVDLKREVHKPHFIINKFREFNFDTLVMCIIYFFLAVFTATVFLLLWKVESAVDSETQQKFSRLRQLCLFHTKYLQSMISVLQQALFGTKMNQQILADFERDIFDYMKVLNNYFGNSSIDALLGQNLNFQQLTNGQCDFTLKSFSFDEEYCISTLVNGMDFGLFTYFKLLLTL